MKLNIKTIIIIIVLILFLLNIINNKYICIKKDPVWLIPKEQIENKLLFYYLCPNPEYADFISKKDPLIYNNNYIQVRPTSENKKFFLENLIYIKNDPIFKCARLYKLRV